MNPNLEQPTKQEVEIDIQDLLGFMLSKAWIIALFAVNAIIIAFLYTSFFITPVYTSSTTVNYMINTGLTPSDQTMAVAFVQDSDKFIKSEDFILDAVVKNLTDSGDLKRTMTGSGLKAKTSVSTSDSSTIVTIAVSDNDPELAKKLVDEIANEFCRKLPTVFANEEAVRLTVIQSGKVPTVASNIKLARNIVIAALIGIILSCALLVIMYVLNDQIKTPEDVERYLGLTVLGTIPEMLANEEDDEDSKKSSQHHKHKSGNKTDKPVQAV